MKKLLTILLLLCLGTAVAQEIIYETIEKQNDTELFKITVLNTQPNQYQLQLKNISSRSLYFVDDDFTVANDNHRAIAYLGLHNNPLDDLVYYNVNEIEEGNTQLINLSSEHAINEVVITLIEKKLKKNETRQSS
jgi:hypothetical protein